MGGRGLIPLCCPRRCREAGGGDGSREAAGGSRGVGTAQESRGFQREPRGRSDGNGVGRGLWRSLVREQSAPSLVQPRGSKFGGLPPRGLVAGQPGGMAGGGATGYSLPRPTRGSPLGNQGQTDRGGISGARRRHRLVLGKDRGPSRNRIPAFPGRRESPSSERAWRKTLPREVFQGRCSLLRGSNEFVWAVC